MHAYPGSSFLISTALTYQIVSLKQAEISLYETDDGLS